jgi:hypothetical protein
MTRAQVGSWKFKKRLSVPPKKRGLSESGASAVLLHLNAKGSIQRSFPCYLPFKSYVSSTAADG